MRAALRSRPVRSRQNPAEVLVGTDFYKTFLPETDCECAEGSDVAEADSTVTGTVKGMLMFDMPYQGASRLLLSRSDDRDAISRSHPSPRVP